MPVNVKEVADTSTRMPVQVKAKKEETKENESDHIPPKTLWRFGSIHNTAVALKTLPSHHEGRRNDQENDPDEQETVLRINQI